MDAARANQRSIEHIARIVTGCSHAVVLNGKILNRSDLDALQTATEKSVAETTLQQ